MATRPNTNFPPPPEVVANGTKLASRILKGTSLHAGEISDENGNVRWHYGQHRTRAPWSSGNPLRKPDFVCFERDENDALWIRRVSIFPSIFRLMDAGKAVGTIRLTSILRNKYAIEVGGSNSWTFRMRLYTVYFFGSSAAGPEIWVVVGPSERQWNILLSPGLPVRPLAAILAFIHTERYFYS